MLKSTISALIQEFHRTTVILIDIHILIYVVLTNVVITKCADFQYHIWGQIEDTLF